MSQENYQIRREEWDEVRATLKEIERTLIKLVERENARDDRVLIAQQRADAAYDLASDNSTRLTRLEERTGTNTTTIGDWKRVAYYVFGGLILSGIVGSIGWFIGNGGGP